jgi:DNA-binding transcriptional ArsR family regulator
MDDCCLQKIRALSEENRLKIIRILLRGPTCVNKISEQLGLQQYNTSKHLRILEQARLITRKKNGQQRIYLLAPELKERLPANKDRLIMPCCEFNFNRLKI